MKLFVGIAIGVLICSLAVFGYYFYSNYKIVPKNITASEQIEITLSPSPIPEPTKSDVEITPSTKPETPATKTISGSLGYPSSFVPSLKICLYEYAGPGMIQGPKYCTETEDNDMNYQVTGAIAPAKYVIFAWTSNAEVGAEFGGSYTPAIACGLSVECKDHTPIVLDLSANDTVKGVDIKDWYADAGTYPKKPLEIGVSL